MGNKRRSLKITYLLAAFLGWTASAAIANAAPIFRFASFAMSGIDVTVMNVTVSGAFINGNGGANPNPCGTGVTSCAFMVSGNPYGPAAATNMTINSAASWNTVSNRVGLGPDKQYGTADDVHLAVNSTFGYEPTQVAGDFLAPSLQTPFVGTHFTMSLRSTTNIAGCTTSVTTCLQGFDTGFVNFQLTAAQMALLASEDIRTLGLGNLLHVSIGQLHDPSSPGSAGGLNGTRNSTSNGGFKGDADHTVPVTATSDNFSFTSDFLDFGTQDRSALSWALGTLVPCLTRNAAATANCTSAAAATGNFLHSVKLSGVVGNFGANPEPRSIFTTPVPEPSGISLGLLGSLLVGVSLMAGKRRSVVGSR